MVPINVTLYHFNGDNRQISKSLSDGILYTAVNFRESIDFHDPEFTIEATIDPSYNYCEITFDNESPAEDVHKYYFASVENVREGLSVIRCRIDVLTSYAAAILPLPVWCLRSSQMQTAYIPDGKAPIETRKFLAGDPADAISAHSSDMILFTVG